MSPGSSIQSRAKRCRGARGRLGCHPRDQEGPRKESWEAKGHGEGGAVVAGVTSGPVFVTINALLQIPKEKLGTWDL